MEALCRLESVPIQLFCLISAKKVNSIKDSSYADSSSNPSCGHALQLCASKSRTSTLHKQLLPPSNNHKRLLTLLKFVNLVHRSSKMQPWRSFTKNTLKPKTFTFRTNSTSEP